MSNQSTIPANEYQEKPGKPMVMEVDLIKMAAVRGHNHSSAIRIQHTFRAGY
jgi:hypothetical protein